MKKLLTILCFILLTVGLAHAFPIPPGGSPEEAVYDNGSCTTTLAVDYRNSSSQLVALGGNCTVSWVLPQAGFRSAVVLKITQHTGVHYNISWTSTKWDSGLVPLITQSDGAIDFISCYLDSAGVYCTSGSNWQ